MKFKRRIMKDDLVSCKGMIIKDVAHILRRDYDEVKRAIRKCGVRSLFPSHGGEATWIARRGYTGE
jgi:hypothetical protein